MTAAWRHVDFVLVILTLATSLFGTVLVYSATKHKPSPDGFVSKQLAFVVVGIGAMVLCAIFDYQRMRDWARLIYLGTIVMLGAVLVPGVGSVHKNIRAWFDLPGFQIQPAEIAKVAVIVVLAAYLGTLTKPIQLRHLLVALVLMGVPMGLILLQPDLGTMLVFVVIGVGMLVVAGVPARYLLVLVLLGVGGVVGILSSNTLDQYQKDRLTSFVSPDTANKKITYNTTQAQTAIASGGLTGKGLFDGPQTKGGFVPEQQTDFIFTVAGEELGFAGSAMLLLLEGLIVWRVWRTALLARDDVGRLMCTGVACMLVFHIFENVGMNLGIMPVTGIPLPFISYGGSATIASFAAIGLSLNVHMRRFS